MTTDSGSRFAYRSRGHDHYWCAGCTDDCVYGPCCELRRVEGLPSLPDHFGVVWPDGSVSDVTESARLFDQDPEDRARLIASKIQGRPVRIVTGLESLPPDGSQAPPSEPQAPCGALFALALSARAMVEDGHPDSPEWFRIMAGRVNAVNWEAIDNRDLGYD